MMRPRHTLFIDYVIRVWERPCEIATEEGIVIVAPVGEPVLVLIHNPEGLTTTTIHGGQVLEIERIKSMVPCHPSKELLDKQTLKDLKHLLDVFGWTSDEIPKVKQNS